MFRPEWTIAHLKGKNQDEEILERRRQDEVEKNSSRRRRSEVRRNEKRSLRRSLLSSSKSVGRPNCRLFLVQNCCSCVRSALYLWQCIKMCSMVNTARHRAHRGWGCLSMMNEWVIYVCPMRRRAMAVSSIRDLRFEEGQKPRFALLRWSLVVVPWFVHVCCQNSLHFLSYWWSDVKMMNWNMNDVRQTECLCGRHKIRRSHLWSATPLATRSRWSFRIDLFSRTDRELPPQVVDAMFEEVLADISNELPKPLVVLATDGSVTSSTPRSGWGCVMRDSDGSLETYRGGCNLRLSSMRAELEAIFRGLGLVRSAHPDLAACIICTDSQSLLRKLESGSAPPEWHDLPQQVVWVYCPGHAESS